MKKLIVLAGSILCFSLVNLTVSAQTASSPDKSTTVQTQQTAQPAQGKFTDANKDGVCDNHQAKAKNTSCKEFTDKNGDGKCDNCTGKGTCTKGTCGGQKAGNGCGQGMQHQHGKGGCTAPCKTPCKK